MFWGLSAALDLYEEYLNAHKSTTQPDDIANNQTEQNVSNMKDVDTAGMGDATTGKQSLNILIYGAGDARHVIKTLAKRYTHKNLPFLNIYMIDACIEITARNMLLLAIALETPESFNLLAKTHLFMDIYGNALMRPTSHHYMAAKAKSLLKMITDDDELQRLAPMLSIEHLKYIERDGLENAFTFWQPNEQHIYNIENYWSARLRKYLGVRYDYRHGAFDWDLNMTLKERGAQQICSQEYRYWRDCGIAFVFPEYEHCKPNKTLAAGLVRNGRTFIHRGYIGDIHTGPFCAFGLRSKEERLHKSQHGMNDYRATDITERNLLELFHELQTGEAYVHDPTISRKYGSVQLLMGKHLIHNECDAAIQLPYDKPWIYVPSIKLYYLSANEALQLQNGVERWHNFFDIVFVGYNFFGLLSKSFADILQDNALLLLETKLLSVERKELVNEFETKQMNYAKSNKLTPVLNYQAINAQNHILKFTKKN